MIEVGDIIKRYKKPSSRSADYYIVIGKSHSSRSKSSLYIVGFYNDKTVSTGWVLHEIYFDNFKAVGHIDINAQIDKEIKLITEPITVYGKTMCVSDWIRKLQIPMRTIYRRVEQGNVFAEDYIKEIIKIKGVKL